MTTTFEIEEKSLIDSCVKGEREAQYLLYNKYAKAMFNICYRMMNNYADAEDAMQEAFVNVFTQIEKFQYQSTLGAWIKRIVVNHCINLIKKRKLDIDFEVELVLIDESSIDEVNIEHDIKRVKEAILSLADGYRIVLSLYLLEGYDHKEIADVLGISESTSKSQYSRAKKKLLSILN